MRLLVWASAFQKRGEYHKAIAVNRRAVALRPDVAENYLVLGTGLLDQGELNEAMACFHSVLALEPDSADAHNSLGNVLKLKEELEQASASYRRALSINPEFAEAHNNLGNVLAAKGEIDDAIACYRRALEVRRDFAGAHSNLIYTFHFHPAYDAQALLKEQLLWDQRHGQPLKIHNRSHANDRSPDRRLKVGYVSPDFRKHVVAWNLLPLLREHDHQKFEIFCYSSALRTDAYTQQIQ